jgi:pimeloyl-ACP methyl ester carboxylesterase
MNSELVVREIAIGPDVFSYSDVGRGQSVLFLHGALGDRRTWQRQSLALAKRFRCLAYTQRYFGTTAWREEGPPFGVATHAADAIAFAEEISAGPINLVAWSYAGQAAMQAAIMRPELFNRVLVYEPGVPSYVSDPAARAAFSRDVEAMFKPIFNSMNVGDVQGAIRHLIDGSGGEEGYFDRQSPDRQQIELENAPSMARLLAQIPPPQISCEMLEALQVPVSIIWGAKTRPLFKIPSMAAAACISSGRHREIPAAGHLWPDEAPLDFAHLIETWLDGAL